MPLLQNVLKEDLRNVMEILSWATFAEEFRGRGFFLIRQQPCIISESDGLLLRLQKCYNEMGETIDLN